jgi:zinc protease
MNKGLCTICKIILLIIFLMNVMNAQYESSRLTVVELNQPNSPVISFRVMINVGSINDPSGKEGLNALTALLISSGGTIHMPYREVVKKLFPMAADIKVIYDKEVTTFIGEVHKDNLEKYYKIFTELLINPRFDPEDFKRNKDDLINYLENTLRANDDENLGKAGLELILYDNHPYRNPPEGTLQGLKSITISDVIDHYSKYYTQGNIFFGIAGGYEKEFIGRIKEDFSYTIAYPTRKERLPEPEKIKNLEILLIEKECIATAISLGFPIETDRSKKDFYALLIANSYLGEHRTFNGVLMNHMRGLRGLNYGDYSYIENFIQDGSSTFPVPNIPRRQQYFSIWIRPVEHNKRHFALRESIYELNLLYKNGMSKPDFDATKKFILNYSKLWVQTQSRRLGYLLDAKFYRMDSYIECVEKELRSITLEDVNSAIKKYLNPNNLKASIVSRDCEEFKKDLIDNKTSLISYSSPVSKQVLDEDKIIQDYKLEINKEKIKVVKIKEIFEK